MDKRVVIDRKHLPVNLPIMGPIALGLLLDRLGAPGWLWGAVGVLVALVWVLVIVKALTHDEAEPAYMSDVADLERRVSRELGRPLGISNSDADRLAAQVIARAR